MSRLAILAEETSEVTVGANAALVLITISALVLTILVVALVVRWSRRQR